MINIPANVREVPYTLEQAILLLQDSTDEYGLFLDLDRILETEAWVLNKLSSEYKKFYAILGTTMKIRENKGAHVVDLALKKFDCPKTWLMDGGKPAFNGKVRERLLNRPELSDDLREYVNLINTISKLETTISSYTNVYKNLPLSKALSKRKTRMVIARPTWVGQGTGRIGAQNPAVTNLDKTLKDWICEPEGMTFATADSRQVEPRIIYSWLVPDPYIKKYITEYDDAYFGLYFYAMATEEELRSPDFIKHPITQELKELRKGPLKTLTNATNYNSNLKDVDPYIAERYRKRITDNPYRVSMLNSLREQINRGTDVFYSYFGTPVRPESNTKYTQGEDGWMDHLIKCGVNNPVQTTAADLMKFSIKEYMNLYFKHQYLKLAYWKHDEVGLYLPDDKVDLRKQEIQDIVAYQVADWIPIQGELELGRREKANDIPSIF